MSRDTDEALAAAWHELMGRYHRVVCHLDRALQSAHSISLSDFEVLQQLHAAPDDRPTKMHDLGEQVHLSQSALSRLITRLERDGLVERCMCTDDRRSVLTKITPAGVERYLAARPTHRAILREQASGCIEQSEATFSATTR